MDVRLRVRFFNVTMPIDACALANSMGSALIAVCKSVNADESGGPRIIGGVGAERAIGRRQRPGLVHQIREPYPAPP
jgi:hypothetical protein